MTKKSFDYDETISFDGRPNRVVIDLINEYAANGHICIIVTARNRDFYDIQLIDGFICEHNLPISEVYFTNHELKGVTLFEAGADTHYDDSDKHLESAARIGIKAFKVDGDMVTEFIVPVESSLDRVLKRFESL